LTNFRSDFGCDFNRFETSPACGKANLAGCDNDRLLAGKIQKVQINGVG